MSKEIFALCKKLIEEKGVPDIVLAIAPSASVSERDIRLGNDRGEAGESLSINKGTGTWYDHATGDKGDLLELWRRICGLGGRLNAASDMVKHFGLSADKKPAKSGYVPITPVPDDAPEPPIVPGMAHPGRPDHQLLKAWRYADAEDRTHHYRVRYDGPEDENGKRKKVVVPLSYCGADGWRFKGPSGFSPIIICKHCLQEVMLEYFLLKARKLQTRLLSFFLTLWLSLGQVVPRPSRKWMQCR